MASSQFMLNLSGLSSRDEESSVGCGIDTELVPF